MAIIPTEDLRTGALPGFDAPRTVLMQNQAPQDLARFGQGLTEFGASLDRVGDEMKAVVDTARVKERAKLAAERGLNARVAFGKLNGKAAVDGRDQALKGLEESFRQLGDGLDNDEQREAVREVLDQELLQVRGAIENHTIRQAEIYDQSETEGLVETNKKTAILAQSQGDAEGTAQARAYVESYARELAELRGLGEEGQKAFVRENVDNLHARVLDALSEKPADARAYLAQNPDVPPGLRAKAERVLKTDDDRQAAYAVLSTPELAQLSTLDKLARLDTMLAEKKITLDVRDIAVRRAVDDEQRVRAVRKAAEADLLGKGADWASANQGVDLSRMDPKLQDELKTAGLWDDVEAIAVNKMTLRPAGLAMLTKINANPARELEGRTWQEVFTAIAPVMDLDNIRAVQAAWGNVNGKKDTSTELQSDLQFKIELAQMVGILGTDAYDEKDVEKNAPEFMNFIRRLEVDGSAEGRRLGHKLSRDELRAMVKSWPTGELGGQEVRIPMVDPAQRGDIAVVNAGQRVLLRDVMNFDQDTETFGGVTPAARAQVVDYNIQRVSRGLPPLDPDNARDAAFVMAGVRAETARRESEERVRETEQRAKARWTEMQENDRKRRLQLDLIQRRIPLNDPEWLQLTDPAEWERRKPMIEALRRSQRETQERRQQEAANPWRR